MLNMMITCDRDCEETFLCESAEKNKGRREARGAGWKASRDGVGEDLLDLCPTHGLGKR